MKFQGDVDAFLVQFGIEMMSFSLLDLLYSLINPQSILFTHQANDYLAVAPAIILLLAQLLARLLGRGSDFAKTSKAVFPGIADVEALAQPAPHCIPCLEEIAPRFVRRLRKVETSRLAPGQVRATRAFQKKRKRRWKTYPSIYLNNIRCASSNARVPHVKRKYAERLKRSNFRTMQKQNVS